MRSFSIFLLCSILLFLISCQRKHDKHLLLDEINALIETSPDSALALLNTAATSKDMNASEKAEYFLLLTQLQDKMYVVYTTDSLIKIAVDYYDANGTFKEKQLSLFYKDKVCSNIGNINKEGKDSVRAHLLHCLSDNNIHLRALGYNELSKLEEKNGNYEASSKYYKEFIAIKDTIEYTKSKWEAGVLINKHLLELKNQRLLKEKREFLLIGIITILIFMGVFFLSYM